MQVDNPIPKEMWSKVGQLWNEFILDPSDWQRLDHLDLAVRVFAAKWAFYAQDRRIADANVKPKDGA